MLGDGSLVGPGSGQNAFHRVVALVARVFEQRLVTQSHGNFRGPRLSPSIRIVDSEFVDEGVIILSSQALN